METKTGIVEKTFGSGTDFKFKVDGVYYSNKFKPAPEISNGDEVRITYKYNPAYKNQFWSSVEVTSAGVGASSSAAKTAREYFPVPYNSDKRAIIRQNALTNAVNHCTNMLSTNTDDEIDVDYVISVASKFEEYTSGDMDRKILAEVKAEEENAA